MYQIIYTEWHFSGQISLSTNNKYIVYKLMYFVQVHAFHFRSTPKFVKYGEKIYQVSYNHPHLYRQIALSTSMNKIVQVHDFRTFCNDWIEYSVYILAYSIVHESTGANFLSKYIIHLSTDGLYYQKDY